MTLAPEALPTVARGPGLGTTAIPQAHHLTFRRRAACAAALGIS